MTEGEAFGILGVFGGEKDGDYYAEGTLEVGAFGGEVGWPGY